MLGSKFVNSKHIPSHFAVEALTCYHAILLALNPDFQSTLFERASFTVIYKLLSPQSNASILSPYIRDIFVLIGCLHDYRFVHFPHTTNQVTHLLAPVGLQDRDLFYRTGVKPFFISATGAYGRSTTIRSFHN